MKWLAFFLLCVATAGGSSWCDVRLTGDASATRRSSACGQGGAPLRLRGGTAIANLAAYMLLKMGGNAEPKLEDVKNVLDSVGANVDEEMIAKICTDLKGQDIDDLIEKGKVKMAEESALFDSVQRNKAGVGVGGGGGEGGGDGDGVKKSGGDKEGKKEDKAEEKKESASSLEGGSDDDMGFGLFD